MLKNLFKNRNQSGDTIVEVMLVVAILGLTFGAAYSIASASVAKTRNAQEHAEALQYLNSQVEMMRSTSADQIVPVANLGPFCIESPSGTPRVLPHPSCAFGTEGRYQVQINYDEALGQNVYVFQVDWAGVANLGPQRERISYKLHNQ